ncbi:MFS transporter [uncultured Nocardioides sp.]|uniref:MFS transporter n=1 Tax=uncultured Nocardioides sp. TaxID=198441 RepID=UPI002627E6A4|nr:MFS transporter [uncultured Nocardioides sp.]
MVSTTAPDVRAPARSVAVALAGTLLIASTYGMARFGVGLFAPRLVAERPDLEPVVGWAAAAQFVSYAVAATIAARVSDRRPRALVLAAGTTAALGCLGVATTASPTWFVVLVLVGGAGAGLASPALVRVVDAVTPPRSAATAQALVNTGTAVGVVVAGVLALAVPSTTVAWWTMAAINALAAAAVLLLAGGRSGRDGTATATASGSSYDWRPLATPAVAAVVAGAGSALVWSYGPLIATGSGQVADSRVGLLWIVLGIGGLAGPLTGRLVAGRGLAGAWSWSVGAVALASVALAAAVDLGLAWPAYVAMACFGAGYMCLSGVLILWARDVWPEAAGRGTSVLFVALAVGQAVGAVGFDAWRDVAGGAGAAATAALLCLAGAVVVRRR